MKENAMKSTGMVRKIDGLGRIVVPMEIRRSLMLHPNDPLEIFMGYNGEIVFKKTSALNPIIEVAATYAKALHKTLSHPIIIVDRDTVICSAGIPAKDIINQSISKGLHELMHNRTLYFAEDVNSLVSPIEGLNYQVFAMIPIVSYGEICGAILLITTQENTEPPVLQDSDKKVLLTAVDFLSIIISE